MKAPLADGLAKLLAHEPAAEVEDVFGLCFEATYEAFGEPATVELRAGGAATPVTGENRAEYVQAYCDWVLNRSVAEALAEFRRGFSKLLGGPTLQLFSPEQLELLVAGEDSFDFAALERVTQYDGGYTASSEAVRRFWRVAHAMPLELRKKLLLFTTGSAKSPIGGLGNLVFRVQRNGDASSLPGASTCFNLLLLPPYPTDESMREKLTLAIEECEGFGRR